MALSLSKFPLAMAIGALACSNLVAYDTVVSNYNGSNISRDQIGGGFANAFTVGDTDAVLNSVSLYFKVSSPDTSFTVNIYSNSGGTIGSLLCSSSLTGLTTGSQLLTFSSFTGTTTTLDASTTYWLAISADGNASSTSGWYDADIASTSSSGWTIENPPQYYSSSVWSSALSATPQQFSISATSVPEPSEYAAMLGLASLSLAAVYRRKKK